MRRPLDLYETAAWQVDALTDNLPELSGWIWCPCVGDRSLLRQLQHNRPDLVSFVTNDIDPTKRADFHFDATSNDGWLAMLARFGRPDWVIENPPFNLELPILEHAYRYARCGVVFMARVSFAEPTKDRGPWLEAHGYDKRITLERYSFTGNGKSDSATTDWLVWAKVPIAKPFGVSAYGYKHGTVKRSGAAVEVA